MYSIYKATSPSGKIYIGMTTQPFSARKSQHKCHARGSKNIFHKALKKYGFESFSWEIIFETPDLGELGRKEAEFIEKFKSNLREFGYNEKTGGQSGWTHSDETKARMSSFRFGKKMPLNCQSHRRRPIRAFKNGALVGEWKSVTQCATELGLDRSCVFHTLSGKYSNTRGFTFEEISKCPTST